MDLNTTTVTEMMVVNTTSTPSTTDLTTANQLHYVMSAVVGPILCIIGFIGNILSIIVWCRSGMMSSTGRYLIGQAIADIGVLLMFILCDSLQVWAPSVKLSMTYGVFFSYIGYPMFFFTVVLSVWITVGVTVDRYIMVCWITSAKKYCNAQRANMGLALITMTSFLVNLPHFASFTLVHTENSTTFELTSFGGGSGGQFYEFWIHCIILILIPWVSVLFMNIKIISKITESNRRMSGKKTRESMKKSKQSENQITRLLLTVTFTFLFFIGLQCVIQCFQMQQPSWANLATVSSAFAFAKTGIVFNSSLNFVFYCLSGRRFRVELLRMFGLVKRDLQTSSLVYHSTSSGGTRSISSGGTRSTSSTGI